MTVPIPPVVHECCGTPCFAQEDDPEQPCWGKVICIDHQFIEDDDGGIIDEVRYAACQGHIEMYDGGQYTRPR